MSAALVLCGGRSSRMGRPKALLPWNGVPMIVHMVRTVRRVVDEIVVVSTPDLELPALEAHVVLDEKPFLGPLAGLAAGLSAIESGAAFVTATDTPWLQPALVAELLSMGPTVAVERAGFVQPLLSVLPRSAGVLARELLAAGERRPLRLLEALEFHRADAASLPGGDALQSLNTPAEYLDALRAVDPDATASVEFCGHARLAAGLRERRVAIGTLAEVLERAAPGLPLLEERGAAGPWRVSIGTKSRVRDLALPIGADERVVVMDAPMEAGGLEPASTDDERAGVELSARAFGSEG